MPNLAFVVKCYDSHMTGGAETLAREFSRRLIGEGVAVEILTTCLREYQDWRNVYSSGLHYVDGIPVRRFPIWLGRSADQHAWLSYKIGNRLTHSEDDVYRWLHEGLHSPQLYQHLQQHGRQYDLVIVLDYSVSLSPYAAAANQGRTAAWPLLHNEPFAYLPAIRRWLNAAHGIMFNTVPESHLAYYGMGVSNPHSVIVGVGVETSLAGKADRFRFKYQINQPFILYVGRLDMGKNLTTLIAYFQRYKAERGMDLRLVLLGKGPLKLENSSDILSLGFCSDEDKLNAYAAALALCQPSLYESLSIVSLEALAQRTPILVHGANEVTRYHCLAGNCGLYFYTYRDFALALDYLYQHPAVRHSLGQNGRSYVQENYTWDNVMARLSAALNRFGSAS